MTLPAELMSRPLTLEGYRQVCTDLHVDVLQGRSVHVQVKRQGEILCAQVASCDRFRDREWFKVVTPIGTGWVESRNVRLCSGDGACVCEDVKACQ